VCFGSQKNLSIKIEDEKETREREKEKTQNAFQKAVKKEREKRRMGEWKDERMKNHLIFNP
jgi:hypothetical protein